MRVESLDDQQKRDMSRCLHCSEPCEATALFCDSCQAQLYQLEAASTVPGAYIDIADASTASHPIVAATAEAYKPELVRQDKNTPLPLRSTVDEIPLSLEASQEASQKSPVSSHGMYVNMVEHAIHRLNDAAQRIASVDQSDKRQPHASRLSPIRDISADIQRHSTPLPKAIAQANDMQQNRPEASANDMPDLWPWLHDADDIENNTFENYTDPLLARRFPSSSEAARIEAEDERRAKAEGVLKNRSARKNVRHTQFRIAFVSLAILAILALTIDTVLVSVAFLHPHHTVAPVSGPPTLMITVQGSNDNKVSSGQNIIFHLMHFNPSTNVYITHDVGVPIILSTNFPIVRVNNNGAATAYSVISSGWGPGFHNIEAEDMTTHYTANATLQIINAGPSKPSHLIIKDLSLDAGSGYQGSNTIKSLTLYNDENASGAITWAASSNSPWLLLTPNQGTFSDSQTLSIGVERGLLTPGSYNGTITFSSNVGAPLVVKVTMVVTPLPPDAGAVMVVTPVVLSFTAVDGVASSTSQILTLSNPGRKTLSWSLTNNQSSVAQTPQGSFPGMGGTVANWLNTDVTSGTVPPGATESINVTVNSQGFLPGAYTDPLVFNSPDKTTINQTQNVSVSLTVQPHCSLILGTGGMTFNAVAGSSNTSNQALSVTPAPSCSSAVAWTANSSAGWLSVTPASGSAKTGANSVITVGVNTTGMTQGTYPGTITVVCGQGMNGSTQTVSVTLTVQPPPPPGSPIMAAAPLIMSFSTVQGQPITSGQTVVITNSGQNAMQWRASVGLLATVWLGVSPTGGTINPGQTATLTVVAGSSGLTPNTYNGQITLNGYDAKTGAVAAGGSPQVVSVQLQVNPPCALVQPSSSALAFSSIQGGSDPVSQAVTLTASGNCAWPLGWTADVSSGAPWLKLSSHGGKFGQGSLSTTLNINPTSAGLSVGTYTASVAITTTDNSGVVAQGSPQVFSITLTVLPPCQLLVSPGNLAYNVVQGQASSPHTLSISETGACTRPVTWTATSDSTWLTLTSTTGSDMGSGSSVGVSVNASGLVPRTYTGNVTVTANGGTASNMLTQTIPVSVTVTGFAVSGTVNACADAMCATPISLPGAAVTLTGPGGVSMSTTADLNGNYSFSNVPLGACTITASGLNAASIHYTGSTPVTVTGNMPGVNVPLQVGS